MDTKALIRVARQQVMLATRHLDSDDSYGLRWRISEIEIRCIKRNLKTTRAGIAGTFHSRGPGDIGYIGMSLNVCHTEERFMHTLLHEFAHAVVAWLFPGEHNLHGHGQIWQDVMKHLGQPPDRCHEYKGRITL
jgi:hypothetical protein